MKYDSKFIGAPVKIITPHPWEGLVGTIQGTVGNESYKVAIDPHQIKPDRIIAAKFLQRLEARSA